MWSYKWVNVIKFWHNYFESTSSWNDAVKWNQAASWPSTSIRFVNESRRWLCAYKLAYRVNCEFSLPSAAFPRAFWAQKLVWNVWNIWKVTVKKKLKAEIVDCGNVKRALIDCSRQEMSSIFQPQFLISRIVSTGERRRTKPIDVNEIGRPQLPLQIADCWRRDDRKELQRENQQRTIHANNLRQSVSSLISLHLCSTHKSFESSAKCLQESEQDKQKKLDSEFDGRHLISHQLRDMYKTEC